MQTRPVLLAWLALLIAVGAAPSGATPGLGVAAHPRHAGHWHDSYYQPYWDPWCHWHDCHHSESEDSPYEDLEGVRRAAALRIVTQPQDAKVSVDGEDIARGEDGSAEVTLLEGVHRLQVRAPGHRPVDRELLVRGGGGRIVEVALEREK